MEFDGHAVQIPLDKCSIEVGKTGNPLAKQLGWNTLLTVLREREMSGRAPSIGRAGAPTQYEVEAMVKDYMAAKKTVIDGVEYDRDLVMEFLREEGLI